MGRTTTNAAGVGTLYVSWSVDTGEDLDDLECMAEQIQAISQDWAYKVKPFPTEDERFYQLNASL